MADILVGRGVRRPAPTLFDLISGPATAAQSALGAMGSAAKGAAQATVGLPGDIESLVRMITGGEQKLPTTEEVGQFVNQYIRAPYSQYERLGEFTGLPVAGALNRPVTQITNEAADALVRAITGNPQATAPQVIRETSMPFMQAVAPRTPGLLETPVKSDLGFYSALEQATVPLQNKGTGSQFLAQIEKTAGVKPDEIKWTGLDEFLKSKPNVTKQEVQDYLAANRVNLQEVRLGGATSPYPYRTANEWQGAIDRAEAAGNWDEAANINQAWEAAEGFGSAGSTKFSKYTLPGGQNYREILLTLPDTKGARLDARRAEIEAKGLNATDAEKQEWASIMNQLQPETRDVEGLSPFRNRPEFRSSHFDQPNILAHMRVNDRVVDGKKTLFIEEIQSDWHQAGRKKGYADKANPWEVFDPVTANVVGRYASEADANAAKAELNKAGGMFDIGKSEGVPDAPFKTTWHELSLKRAIQEASEKGYDQIAFTTGKTQAERYDLSKQVDSLLYSKNSDGTYRVSAQVQGRGQMMGESIPESDLADYVGKEVAEKMAKGTGKQIQVAGKYDPVSMTSDTEYMTELSGEGLKVGGEGMKGFYDNILPKSLDKLGKKFDAKVGKTEMDGVEVWAMDITPKMRESVLTKGQPLFAATPAIPAAGLLGDEGE
jgi:hypothetical protein